MSPDGTSRASTPELDAEQEVDFGRYVRLVAVRWWLVVAGVVAGAIIGYLTTTGASRPYDARTIVYLGQAFPAGGNTPLQNLPTQLSVATQYVTSRPVTTPIARRLDLRPGKLRAAIATKAITGVVSGKVQQATPLLSISVKGFSARKCRDAAQLLADALVRNSSSYVDVKLGVYESRLTRSTRELAGVNQRITDLLSRQSQLQADQAVDPTARLILQANITNALQFYETRQINLEGTQLTLKELVAQAQQIERARVVEPAVATRTSGPARSSALAIGAVIGFLLGIVAALVWEPVTSRLRARSA